MKKPTIDEALELRELKRKVNEAYEAYNQKTSEFANKYGECQHSYEDPNGEGYFRIKLEDNLAKFKRGEPVYKTGSVSQYQLEVKQLKNKPKDLVEE